MLNYTNDHNFGTKHTVNVIQVSICSLEQDLSNDIQDGYFRVLFHDYTIKIGCFLCKLADLFT